MWLCRGGGRQLRGVGDSAGDTARRGNVPMVCEVGQAGTARVT